MRRSSGEELFGSATGQDGFSLFLIGAHPRNPWFNSPRSVGVFNHESRGAAITNIASVYNLLCARRDSALVAQNHRHVLGQVSQISERESAGPQLEQLAIHLVSVRIVA